MNIKKDGKFYWSSSACRLHDNAGVPNLGALSYLNGCIQTRNCGGAGGAKPPCIFFAPPGKMCWT